MPSEAPQKAEGEDPFRKFREAGPKAKGSASSPGAGGQGDSSEINLYCVGYLNRYTGQELTKKEGFEFRTVIDLREKKHTVQSVIKGSLFKSGGSYQVLGGQRDVFILNADSTDPHYEFTSLQFDRVAGRIAGQGSVNMSQERNMLFSRLRDRGMKIPPDSPFAGGLDAFRRVEVDGQCQTF